MRFTDELEVVNEKMGQNLVVREALSQVEMIFGIEGEGCGLSHIYMDVQEVTVLVHAFHAHFRNDVNLNKWIRDSHFSYMGYNDRTNIEIGGYRTTISELDLQHLSILLEKWLKHKGAYHGFYDSTDYVDINSVKNKLNEAVKEKAELINLLAHTTLNSALPAVMEDLERLNDIIIETQKILVLEK
ncbi:hypothetical protein BPS13_0107 [Bacillus phage BPS13]|uniref:Uncharacterized protein n=2 Tax=Wphvirus TaxID=1922327 RepID=W5QUU7_9CAUD|nr:hypothetical protein BPS13_0107 [Bacillus phage BPS13]YP_009002991.1 hypothetical protein BPS10C_105 [Bacillus phage BPS10C]AEZ50286.1 hypothetical protein BPS13_0107 [Bacillus phage BPS13]AGI12102.1 hypothetical protein BPS10C_105 [Bacillus phage BPS10C]